MTQRLLSPSEYLATKASSKKVSIAGRVTRVSKNSLEIADAVASVVVRMQKRQAAGAGDWVVIDAVKEPGGRLGSGRVVQSSPCAASSEEFERLHRGVGQNLVHRAKTYALVRRYFDRNGFVEVDTPVRVPAAGTDVYIEPMAAEGGYLITSPEFQMKRLLVAGMPKIYQLSHVSRNHEIGVLHEPEFSLLEWYRAFADPEAVMLDTEQIVIAVVRALTDKNHLNVLGKHRVDCSAPFERISVKDAFRRYADVGDASDLAASDEDRYFQILVDKIEPALARSKRPIFLCDYPIGQAALAKPKPNDPSYAERFELYLGGVELCNGYGELTDPEMQRTRFLRDNLSRRKRGLAEYPLDERFLDALNQGMPPAAGNALGIDRLLAVAVGAKSIAEVMAFPADRLTLQR